jgi:hypothetical protein
MTLIIHYIHSHYTTLYHTTSQHFILHCHYILEVIPLHHTTPLNLHTHYTTLHSHYTTYTTHSLTQSAILTTLQYFGTTITSPHFTLQLTLYKFTHTTLHYYLHITLQLHYTYTTLHYTTHYNLHTQHYTT